MPKLKGLIVLYFLLFFIPLLALIVLKFYPLPPLYQLITVIIAVVIQIKILVIGFIYLFKTYQKIKSLNIRILKLLHGDFTPKKNLQHTVFQKIEEDLNQVALLFANSAFKQNLINEETLSERNKLAAVLLNIEDGILVVDKNHNVILLNRAAHHFTGLSESDALGKNIKDVLYLSNKNGEVSDLIYCPVETHAKEGTAFFEESIRIKSKTNEDYFANVTSIIVKANNSPLCLIVIHDTTKESKLESMKMDFVSLAAHELRTPLTSIKGYLSVFLQENGSKLNADQKMLLDRVNTSAEQLTSLVENLLNVSRIERGGMIVNMQLMDWAKFVSDIVTDFINPAKEKGIELTFIAPQKAVPQVKADKGKITEVLSNLISNAIKYTQSGGKIIVSIEVTDTEVITHIKDTGHGIAKEAIPYLFNKFYRVDSKLQMSTKGNGLGLFISKSIVDLHHGRIWVESELSLGSTFSFALPI
jgi:PAS domain S-box-containing protein